MTNPAYFRRDAKECRGRPQSPLLAPGSCYVEEGFTLRRKNCPKSSNLKQLWLEGKTFKCIAAFLLQQNARIPMKLTYRRCGDYYLSNIGIPAEDMHPLDKYGRMRLRHLWEHHVCF